MNNNENSNPASDPDVNPDIAETEGGTTEVKDPELTEGTDSDSDTDSESIVTITAEDNADTASGGAPEN